MIKEIMKDQMFLSIKSSDATIEDKQIIIDLLDTIKHHQDACVGMAANMIGELKRIMVVNDEGKYIVLVNPKVLKKLGNYYETQEGCLSLQGVRNTKRYAKIKCEYLNEQFQKRIKTFEGFTAQIIQHELDHFEGIII